MDRLAEMDGTLGELLEAEDVRAVIKFNNELRRLRHEALPGFRPTEYEEAESSVEGQKAIPGPDGSLIVLERQRVVLYGPDGGEPKQLIESDGWLRDVAWAGNYVAAAPDWSSDVFVHDLQSGETKRVSSGGQDYFGAVDVTTDGKVVGGGDEGRIVVWAARSGEQLNSIRVRSNRTSILKVSPDGKSVLVGGERETNPAVYKLDSDGRSDEVWSSNAINYGEAALLEDGRVLVAHNLGAGNSDNTIRIFSGKPGEREEEPVTEYEVFEDHMPITSLAIDSKGRYAIAGSDQSGVLVAIDLENGERTKLHEFDRHVAHVTVDASGELYVKLADSDTLHKLQPKLG